LGKESLRGNIVTWRNNKQNVVARFSTEVEFQIILDTLKVKYVGLIKLFCDNNSTINITHNLVQNDRTKHI
ncbi:hypothetical protein CR513_44375, partial [Mucuna pruriens]